MKATLLATPVLKKGMKLAVTEKRVSCSRQRGSQPTTFYNSRAPPSRASIFHFIYIHICICVYTELTNLSEKSGAMTSTAAA